MAFEIEMSETKGINKYSNKQKYRTRIDGIIKRDVEQLVPMTST